VKDQGFRLRTGRVGFFILSVLFAASVLAQVYIAGAATFVNPANWAKHIEFVHLFGFTIPLLMLIFAFIGRLPRRSLIQVMGVMLTIFLMYFTANITRTLPWAGALHPVIAVVIAGQSIVIVTNAWNLIRKNKRGELTK
jgi:mercuric ion transport protein